MLTSYLRTSKFMIRACTSALLNINDVAAGLSLRGDKPSTRHDLFEALGS